jgi:hypothetical protein
MKTLLLILTLAILPASYSCNGSESVDEKTNAGVTVYVCNGPSSLKYHKYSRCRGLVNCSTKIETVTLEQAKAKKRTPCKICY